MRKTNFYLGLQDAMKDKIWSVFTEEQIMKIEAKVDLEFGYDQR